MKHCRGVARLLRPRSSLGFPGSAGVSSASGLSGRDARAPGPQLPAEFRQAVLEILGAEGQFEVARAGINQLDMPDSAGRGGVAARIDMLAQVNLLVAQFKQSSTNRAAMAHHANPGMIALQQAAQEVLHTGTHLGKVFAGAMLLNEIGQLKRQIQGCPNDLSRLSGSGKGRTEQARQAALGKEASCLVRFVAPMVGEIGAGQDVVGAGRTPARLSMTDQIEISEHNQPFVRVSEDLLAVLPPQFYHRLYPAVNAGLTRPDATRTMHINVKLLQG